MASNFAAAQQQEQSVGDMLRLTLIAQAAGGVMQIIQALFQGGGSACRNGETALCRNGVNEAEFECVGGKWASTGAKCEVKAESKPAGEEKAGTSGETKSAENTGGDGKSSVGTEASGGGKTKSSETIPITPPSELGVKMDKETLEFDNTEVTAELKVNAEGKRVEVSEVRVVQAKNDNAMNELKNAEDLTGECFDRPDVTVIQDSTKVALNFLPKCQRCDGDYALVGTVQVIGTETIRRNVKLARINLPCDAEVVLLTHGGRLGARGTAYYDGVNKYLKKLGEEKTKAKYFEIDSAAFEKTFFEDSTVPGEGSAGGIGGDADTLKAIIDVVSKKNGKAWATVLLGGYSAMPTAYKAYKNVEKYTNVKQYPSDDSYADYANGRGVFRVPTPEVGATDKIAAFFRRASENRRFLGKPVVVSQKYYGGSSHPFAEEISYTEGVVNAVLTTEIIGSACENSPGRCLTAPPACCLALGKNVEECDTAKLDGVLTSKTLIIMAHGTGRQFIASGPKDEMYLLVDTTHSPTSELFVSGSCFGASIDVDGEDKKLGDNALSLEIFESARAVIGSTRLSYSITSAKMIVALNSGKKVNAREIYYEVVENLRKWTSTASIAWRFFLLAPNKEIGNVGKAFIEAKKQTCYWKDNAYSVHETQLCETFQFYGDPTQRVEWRNS